MDKRLAGFKRLLDIMDELREKCPWDKEQTIDSIRHLTIEETYELAESIIEKDYEGLKKELGDVLLHIVFYAKMAEEASLFGMADVLDAINTKLVFRHPHVFGDCDVNGDSNLVKENWEALKMKEGNKTLFGGVPRSLPAMIKAYRLQDKARSVGFDWEERKDVWKKVEEELREFQREIESGDKEKMEAEMGDLLFSLINAARLYDIEPDKALERTNQKFIQRFNYMEQKSSESGQKISDMTLRDMDILWNEAKTKQ